MTSPRDPGGPNAGPRATPAPPAGADATQTAAPTAPMLSGIEPGCTAILPEALWPDLAADHVAGAAHASRSHPPAMFHRVMDATLMNVRRALADLRARFEGRVDPDALGRLELVLAEVLNNITLHGTPAGPVPGAQGTDAGQAHAETADAAPITVHLTVTQQSGGLACAVVDDGTPLPPGCLVFPDRIPSPELSAARAGGFGWFIIRDLTHALFYFREGTRNVLCFGIPQCDARIPHRAAGAA